MRRWDDDEGPNGTSPAYDGPDRSHARNLVQLLSALIQLLCNRGGAIGMVIDNKTLATTHIVRSFLAGDELLQRSPNGLYSKSVVRVDKDHISWG
jgi:hypothetical protein